MSNPTREAVLETIRRAASEIAGKRLTREAFLTQSGMKVSDVFRYFPKWSDALSATGLAVEPYNQKIEPEDLLKDWGEIVREHRKIPTRNAYKLQGKYSPNVFASTFGSWSEISTKFREFAFDRPEWEDVLALLPTNKSISDTLQIKASPANLSSLSIQARKSKWLADTFVGLDRVSELRGIISSKFDLAKLIRLCEELNDCYANGNYYSVGMLIRAILDHVPPIFGLKTFSEVANNYSGNGRSFKQAMQHLDTSSRSIADLHLHTQIRSKEILPNKMQVNFLSDLDLLLAEIIRILK